MTGLSEKSGFFFSVGMKWKKSWFLNLISSRLPGKITKITSKWETKKGLSSFQTVLFLGPLWLRGTVAVLLDESCRRSGIEGGHLEPVTP